LASQSGVPGHPQPAGDESAMPVIFT
jgi:hypothetical protein